MTATGIVRGRTITCCRCGLEEALAVGLPVREAEQWAWDWAARHERCPDNRWMRTVGMVPDDAITREINELGRRWREEAK